MVAAQDVDPSPPIEGRSPLVVLRDQHMAVSVPVATAQLPVPKWIDGDGVLLGHQDQPVTVSQDDHMKEALRCQEKQLAHATTTVTVERQFQIDSQFCNYYNGWPHIQGEPRYILYFIRCSRHSYPKDDVYTHHNLDDGLPHGD